jgi:hypothetical protein
MGRSAFIVRRESRYLFRTRWPRCLMPVSGRASIRIALRTADYRVALRRASRIASWVLRMKTAENIEQAFREIVPKLQELAVQPVRNEDDLTERMALRCTVFDLVGGLRNAGMEPNEVAPGWADCFITLTRENARAERELEQGKSAIGLLEANRRAMVQRGEMPVFLPPNSRTRPGSLSMGARSAAFRFSPSPRLARLKPKSRPAAKGCSCRRCCKGSWIAAKPKIAIDVPIAKSVRSSSSPSSCSTTR